VEADRFPYSFSPPECQARKQITHRSSARCAGAGFRRLPGAADRPRSSTRCFRRAASAHRCWNLARRIYPARQNWLCARLASQQI